MELGPVLAAFLCCGLLCCSAAPEDTAKDYDQSTSRRRRALVYPAASTLLLIFGLGTPLQLGRESVIVGAFTKLLYALPSNATDMMEPGLSGARREGPRSRWSLYRALAGLADVYGFGEGRACVLRAICEAAAAPFEPGNGLLHQLLQSLLSPSSSHEELEEYHDREYWAAERVGKHVDDNCHTLYPECRRSILDVFSIVKSIQPSLHPNDKLNKDVFK